MSTIICPTKPLYVTASEDKMISIKTFSYDLLGLKGKPAVKFASIFEEVP